MLLRASSAAVLFMAVALTAMPAYAASATTSVSTSTAPVLAAPTNLSIRCNRFDGTATLSWNAVAGASRYLLNVDNLSNNGSACVNGWYCAGTDDIRTDGQYGPILRGHTYTMPFVRERIYAWWVVAVGTSSEDRSPTAVGVAFGCGTIGLNQYADQFASALPLFSKAFGGMASFFSNLFGF